MINEKKLTPYYGEIANQLNEIIPVEWEKVVMYGEELGDVSSVSFYFYTKEGNEIHYSGNIPEDFSVSRDIFKRLLRELRGNVRALWHEFKNADEATWYTITFILESDWRFKTKFGYELDKEIGDFEREVIWAYNELGLTPKGEFAKEILQEYIDKHNKES